jgi:TrmH family RNA methyltransferase
MRLTRVQVEEFRSLRRKEGRAALGQFLLEGWRSLSAAIAANAPIVQVAVRSDQFERQELEPLRARGVPIHTIGERDLGRVSATEHSQGVIARVALVAPRLEPLLDSGNNLLLALDAVADPGNVGTIIRTADWFGADGVLLGRGSVDPFNDKVVRATAGSIFHVPVVGDVELLEALDKAKVSGFAVTVAVADGALAISNWRPTPRTLVVLGGEAHGVSDAVRRASDLAVAIPRVGRAESLNVAITAGIFLAQLRMR